MGVNNKQRRATKKKRARQQHAARPTAAGARFVVDITPEEARAAIFDVLRLIDDEPAHAQRCAAELLRADGPLPPDLARRALQELLDDLVAGVVAHGWLPSDLVQIVTRLLSAARTPALVGLLLAAVARHPSARVAQEWLDDLDAAGRPATLDLREASCVRTALELATVLVKLPPIAVLVPPPGTATARARTSDGGDPKLLARVRALLAKAESTEYDEEAEALSAKAQELISRHALQRLLEAPAGRPAAEALISRRIWVDPPYVLPKALLLAAVADANQCRSVATQGLDFCTVIGPERALVAVELLFTSLLLQADGAMRRLGAQRDRSGTSRTRSFRQSFLVAYAGRVRERLRATAEEAVQSTGRAGELVPVLRAMADEVRAAAEAMFPHLVAREAAISNRDGWAAGRAAADLARLDTTEPLPPAAG